MATKVHQQGASPSQNALFQVPELAGAKYAKELVAACDAVRLASKLCRVRSLGALNGSKKEKRGKTF